MESDTFNKTGVLGCLYGCALGDAIGLSTEFLGQHLAAQKVKSWRIKENGLIGWANSNRGDDLESFQRPEFAEGDWTDDTDQALLLCRSLLLNKSDLRTDFMKRLRNWSHRGFEEVCDICGCGLGQTTARVLSHPLAQEFPHECALLVWLDNDCKLAPNGAVMRCAPTGCWRYWEDISYVTELAVQAARVTHADPRSVASAIAVSVTIASILNAKIVTAKEIDAAVENGLAAAEEFIEKFPAYLQQAVCLINQAYSESTTVTIEHRKEWEEQKREKLEEAVAMYINTNQNNINLQQFRLYLRLEVAAQKTAPGSSQVHEAALATPLSTLTSVVAQPSPPSGPFQDSSVSLEELQFLHELGPWDGKGMGYALLCLSAGYWALRQARLLLHRLEAEAGSRTDTEISGLKKILFEDVMVAICAEGGDADTNAAVAGSLLGAVLGLQGLPEREGWLASLGATDHSALVKSFLLPENEESLQEMLMVHGIDDSCLPRGRTVQGRSFLDKELTTFADRCEVDWNVTLSSLSSASGTHSRKGN